MQERRKQLGGYMPERKTCSKPIKQVAESQFEKFYKGTEGREVSTTMVFVRMLAKLLRDPEVGKLIVPIIPDEARTFGMEALFRQVGIYSSVGQLYEPVDMDTLLYYKEAKDGQILEEGITEAGSISSFIAAGTAYSNHGINTIPHHDAAICRRYRGRSSSTTSSPTTLPLRATKKIRGIGSPPHFASTFPFPSCTLGYVMPCSRCQCRICWLTIQPSRSKSPSLFRMESAACT